jgi:hypothetical protein
MASAAVTSRLMRGFIVTAILALAVFALVVAWGDAPAVASALRSFPPVLILPVLLLTTWNYAGCAGCAGTTTCACSASAA